MDFSASYGLYPMWPWKPNVEKLRTRRDVRGLIRALRSRDYLIRCAATKALADFGDASATDAIVTLLDDQLGLCRSEAVHALARIGDGRAVAPLCEVVRKGDCFDTIIAVRGLGRIGYQDAFQPICAVLKWVQGIAPPPPGRLPERLPLLHACIEALGHIGDPRAAEQILAVCRVFSDLQQEIVIRALADLGNSVAPTLINALGDERRRVRHIAAKAFETMRMPLPDDDVVRIRYAIAIGDWASVKTMGHSALQSLCSEMSESSVSCQLEDALVRIGPQAVEPLLGLLQAAVCRRTAKGRRSVFPHDEIVAITRTLARIGDIRAIEPCLAVFRTLPDPNMVEALSHFGPPISDSFLSCFQKLVESDSHLLNSDMVKALSHFGPLVSDILFSYLEELGQDDREYVRYEILAALGRIGDARVAEWAIRVLQQAEGQCNEDELLGDAARVVGMVGDSRAWDALLDHFGEKRSEFYGARSFCIQALWAFGKSREPRCLDVILPYLENPDSAQIAATALEELLRTCAQDAQNRQLEKIANIKDALVYHDSRIVARAGSGGVGQYEEFYTETVDFSRIKAIARAELHRRGSGVPDSGDRD